MPQFYKKVILNPCCKIFAEHSFVTVNSISIRRLVTPAKHILISNLYFSIPNDLIKKALKDIGLQLASPLSFLKAGIPEDEFGHIISFRRQVYVIPPTENLKIQTSVVISFKNIDYRIFISSDKIECFICKQPGHVASRCPNTIQNTSCAP
ncbi:unnamed protein product [Psylliodes chrysocephalus]|uniref:CCHC-type domain-containing protein n=1 Tax=Psylliodes chrysocephalus TaxID=3402493 RepID=A0A9P0DDV2_9CUCU|nr:unnamed protein product [Psylliodes chrysocephala]